MKNIKKQGENKWDKKTFQKTLYMLLKNVCFAWIDPMNYIDSELQLSSPQPF